jgi:hypothetical protein
MNDKIAEAYLRHMFNSGQAGNATGIKFGWNDDITDYQYVLWGQYFDRISIEAHYSENGTVHSKTLDVLESDIMQWFRNSKLDDIINGE